MGSDSIPAMKIKRLPKVIVSLLSGMLLLLCQTAFAANSCTLPAVGADDAVATQSCHDASPVTEGAPSSDLCESQCASPSPLPGTVKMSLATADFLALPPHAERQYLVTYIVPPPSSGITRASPPLLPIILCRLLI